MVLELCDTTAVVLLLFDAVDVASVVVLWLCSVVAGVVCEEVGRAVVSPWFGDTQLSRLFWNT